MLSQSLKDQLKAYALADCEKNVSMAAFWHKRIEDRFDYDTAETASAYYLRIQRQWLESNYADTTEQDLEAEALEIAYEEYQFERGASL